MSYRDEIPTEQTHRDRAGRYQDQLAICLSEPGHRMNPACRRYALQNMAIELVKADRLAAIEPLPGCKMKTETTMGSAIGTLITTRVARASALLPQEIYTESGES